MRKFLVTHTDDSVSIAIVLDSKTNQEVINSSPTLSSVTSNRDIVDADIPADHYDIRNAWEDTQTGDQIDVSHQKAKDILLGKLRAERDLELARLDALKVRAEELNDTALVDSIVADKNTLRDCTEDLKAISGTGHNDETILADMKAKAVLPTINN